MRNRWVFVLVGSLTMVTLFVVGYFIGKYVGYQTANDSLLLHLDLGAKAANGAVVKLGYLRLLDTGRTDELGASLDAGLDKEIIILDYFMKTCRKEDLKLTESILTSIAKHRKDFPRENSDPRVRRVVDAILRQYN